MRRVDAPAAGWYPDPRNRTRLRWWDGLDWTDIRRAPPSDAELLSYETFRELEAGHQFTPPSELAPNQINRTEAQQLITEVRDVARSEVDRAAELFTQRARAATRDISPLISEYTNRLLRWVRIAVIVAIVLLVAYFVFQVVAQASLFDWIGDRIDNLTDNTNGG